MRRLDVLLLTSLKFYVFYKHSLAAGKTNTNFTHLEPESSEDYENLIGDSQEKENLLDLSSSPYGFKWDCKECGYNEEEDADRIQNIKATFLYTFYKSEAENDQMGKQFNRRDQRDNPNLLELYVPTLGGGYDQCGNFDLKTRDLKVEWKKFRLVLKYCEN